MPTIEVRPFRRPDRHQVTALVNAHAAAVIPGAAASMNVVLSQFEREPDEMIVDPWVAERRPLVADQDGAVAAAALVLRYRDDPDVGPGYRGVGEIRWLVFWPMAPAGNPYWRDGSEAAQRLLDACLAQVTTWGTRHVLADGALPVPGVYGVPAQWPHVDALFTGRGFTPDVVEVVHLVDLASIPSPGEPRLDGLAMRRLVGINGTRFEAHRDAELLGCIEVELLDGGERHLRTGGLADIGNFAVAEAHRRQGIGTWLLGQAAQWLRLAGANRLLHYATPDETALIAFVERSGFIELTRTRRGWSLPLGGPESS
jgi:GNAT superfamily N-acetyltransferase